MIQRIWLGGLWTRSLPLLAIPISKQGSILVPIKKMWKEHFLFGNKYTCLLRFFVNGSNVSSHVIAIDIDVYSAFAAIFNILCLGVAYDSMRLFYWYLHYIYDLILYLCYVLCIIPCVILLVSFMQS